MRIFLSIVGVIAALVIMFSLAFGLKWAGIQWRGFFGPREAAVEREIYESTPSYVHGMIMDLANYHHEWENSEGDERVAIEALVRQRMIQLNPDDIKDTDLRDWYNKVK